jgi:hypothetical protein
VYPIANKAGFKRSKDLSTYFIAAIATYVLNPPPPKVFLPKQSLPTFMDFPYFLNFKEFCILVLFHQ